MLFTFILTRTFHYRCADISCQARSQNYELRPVASSCLSLRPSVRPSFGPYGTIRLQLDGFFCEIWYLVFFVKTAEKIQDSLKSDKNKGYFTWRLLDIFIISRSVLHRMRNVSGERCRENQNTYFVFNNFLPKIVPFMRKCGKML